MAMINIPSTIDDQQYRYKMPRLISKMESSGNGKKTQVVNMGAVARAIRRPPQYVTKWFGSELGAGSQYTNKAREGERAIVNGDHATGVLQSKLDRFIDKYVLCQKCQLPEIDLRIKADKQRAKNDRLVAKCKACGWAGDLDNNHAVAAFILKNPPDESGLNVKSAEGKPRRRKDIPGGKKEESDEDAHSERDKGAREPAAKEEGKEIDGKQTKKDKSTKKVKSDNDEAKKVKSDDKKVGKLEAVTCFERIDDKHSARKQKDALRYDNDNIKELIDSVRRDMVTWQGDTKGDSFYEEVRNQQLARVFDDKVRLYVVLEALFPEAGGMNSECLDAQRDVIGKFIRSQDSSMPASHVLWCFNAYLSEHPAQAKKRFPLILQVIHNEDWAEKEDFLQYYVDEESEGIGEPGFDIAREAGAPFLTWLAEAYSNDDDEEEGDDE